MAVRGGCADRCGPSSRCDLWGGRLAFDGNGYLFITLGDRQWPSAGDFHDDGGVPVGNPFVSRSDVLPEIWTYGHRNAQGLAVHPETGDVWLNEHGPQGGDELNVVLPGLNYGWPIVGYGVNYTTGSTIHVGTHREDMEPPTHIWVPSIGISGILFYTGNAFPEWRGDMFVGGLRGQRLARLTLDGRGVEPEETLLQDIGRIRDIRQGPDGYIYLAMDGDARGYDGDPTPILRLEPAGRR